MDELARLKKRLSSLHDLRDVIHAIRAMAASRVQEAQSALEGVRNYVAIVEEAIREAASLVGSIEDIPPAPEAPAASTLIVVCSEHGFVGGYNGTLLDHAQGILQPGQRLGIIGRRGAAAAEERGLPLAWQFPAPAYARGVSAIARRVTDAMTEVSDAAIVFARHRGTGEYRPDAKPILPLDPSLLAGVEGRLPPIHQIPPERLLRSLASEYLFAELTSALMEGLVSENGARLLTMQAADQNIGDKLESLEKQERIVRQESITVEMLDVVLGAEAVNDEIANRRKRRGPR